MANVRPWRRLRAKRGRYESCYTDRRAKEVRLWHRSVNGHVGSVGSASEEFSLCIETGPIRPCGVPTI